MIALVQIKKLIRSRKVISLQELARQCGEKPEDVAAAVQLLINKGDVAVQENASSCDGCAEAGATHNTVYQWLATSS